LRQFADMATSSQGARVGYHQRRPFWGLGDFKIF
jgi:hypothetical protein